MNGRVAWVDRKFDFGFPAGLHHEIIERLRGTLARVEERVRDLADGVLTKTDGKGWSIQENVGHLADVEGVFLGRLDDYDAGLDTLRPADMSNRQTHEADHNEDSMESILGAFRGVRGRLVGRLECLASDRFAQAAFHGRLNKPMRIIDMMYFLAEHDDYHLARISELIRA